ncbi:hypothetical protein Dimus_007134 [Dionaea muscipula]
MERFFGNAYRGDPGVPHSGRHPFIVTWMGCVASSACFWIHPYPWTICNQDNWHDKAMLYEQYHWKKAMEKKKPYEPLWNQMGKTFQDSYYINWPVFFP